MTAVCFRLLKTALMFLPLFALSAHAATNCDQDRFMYSQANRLFAANQMLLSALHFSPLRASGCDPEITSRSWLGYASAMSRLQENNEALTTIEAGLRDPKVRAPERESLKMLKAWITGEAAPEFSGSQQVRWQLWTLRLNAPDFQTALKNSQLSPAEKARFSDLDLSLTSAPRKSTWVAGLASSVLPGAGQAYAGNWQAAGLSFVINAVLMGALLDFSQKDMTGAAIAAGGVFSITYIGNIISAAQGATDLNKHNQSAPEAELKADLLPELTF